MELIKEINLNINQPNNFELINIMQGSIHSVRVIAHLYDGNHLYQIPDTVSEYQLLGILPSGKYLIDDKVTKYDANSVTFLINQNMMAKAGYVQFSISLVENADNAIVETFPAKIMVTAIPGQEYEQTDEIPIITETLQEVKRNAESAAWSAQEAKTSELNAKTSELNADTAARNAKTYSDNAKTSEDNAKQSETNAKSSETNASNSMTAAASSADNAAKSATKASEAATTAATKAAEASDDATLSKSYAVGGTNTRENEDTDNAKYYYEQSKTIWENFPGPLELWRSDEPEPDEQRIHDYWIVEC